MLKTLVEATQALMTAFHSHAALVLHLITYLSGLLVKDVQEQIIICEVAGLELHCR